MMQGPNPMPGPQGAPTGPMPPQGMPGPGMGAPGGGMPPTDALIAHLRQAGAGQQTPPSVPGLPPAGMGSMGGAPMGGGLMPPQGPPMGAGGPPGAMPGGMPPSGQTPQAMAALAQQLRAGAQQPQPMPQAAPPQPGQ